MNAIACELRTVRLYGPLGAVFGRVHRLAVRSASEAVRALCVLLPGFESHIMQSKDRGVGYAVFYGKRNLEKDDLCSEAGEDIRIAPVVIGSKNGGLFSIILGAALIAVASFATGGLALGALTGTSGLWGVVGGIGFSMVLGGAIQLLSPTTKPSANGGGGNQGSYIFSGAVNTTAQGNAVPVLYGEMIVGSAVISAGLSAADGTVIAGPVATGANRVTYDGTEAV